MDQYDDGWNWPWIIFIGYKELGLKEEEVLNCTPKKFYALLECALEFNKMKYSSASGKSAHSKVKDGYIDQINW